MARLVVTTRQKAERLFETELPLEGSASIVLPVRLVRGYAQLLIFGISDQPFGVSIEEAPTLDAARAGRFVQIQPTITSSASGSTQQVKTRISPTGSYMRVTIGNLSASPMDVLDFLIQGLPI